MAFGQITIEDDYDNTITLECDDSNSVFGFQPQTIYSGIEPQRSTYGTAQDLAPASTNSVKRLWTFDGLLMPAPDVRILRAWLTGTTRVLSLTDDLWERLLSEDPTVYTAAATDVRLIYSGTWLGKGYHDRAGDTTVFEVSFAAWEI